MFSTPLIFCSSGVATDASTSVALAPMKVVVTWIIGGTISGYCEIGRPLMATTPSRTVMIEITIATMGRLTKKRAMVLLRLDNRLEPRSSAGFSRRRLRRNRHAILNPLKTFDHDLLAGLEARPR